MTRGRPRLPVERFWDHVQKTDGCWEWTSCRIPEGYGKFKVDGRQWRAHRLAWVLAVGPIPDGIHVLHRCDNPPCVRPDHLYLGTHTDNMRDRAARGTWRRAKPSAHDLRGLLIANDTPEAVADAVGVNVRSVRRWMRDYGIRLRVVRITEEAA